MAKRVSDKAKARKRLKKFIGLSGKDVRRLAKDMKILYKREVEKEGRRMKFTKKEIEQMNRNTDRLHQTAMIMQKATEEQRNKK